MKCESCKGKLTEQNKGCELDTRGSNEWLCIECYENLRLK
jgi:hypothetical protein